MRMFRLIISSWAVFQQMISDLTTKDSHRAATLSYAFLANQLGHLALGYIAAAFFNFILAFLEDADIIFDAQKDSIWINIIAASLSAFTWFCVEFVYVVKAKAGNGSTTFPPEMSQIYEDVTVDLLFFWLGAFLVLFFRLDDYHNQLFIVSLIWAVILFLWAMKFFRIRMLQQYIGLPFHKRLMDCEISYDSNHTSVHTMVNTILRSGEKGHWIVTGRSNTKKTSLAVGVATDGAFKAKKSSYLTANSLVEECLRSDSDFENERHHHWSWRYADIVIIDNLVVDRIIQNDSVVISPDQLAVEFWDGYTQNGNCNNFHPFRSANVIWILGTEDNGIISSWKRRLRNRIDNNAQRLIREVRLIP